MTSPNECVQELADLLYDKGIFCDFGIDESSVPRQIEMVQERYPNKAISAVKNWIWWDLDVSEEARLYLEANKILPAMIFANFLIWDSRGRWSEGTSVLTTPLVSFEENCLSITRNTVYILVGKGSRKTVDPEVAGKFYI